MALVTRVRLCLGTLWARLNSLAEQRRNLGILHRDFNAVRLAALTRTFEQKNIRLTWSYYAGNYKVFSTTKDGNGASGDLMLFRDFYGNGVMRRIGFESWLLPVHYRHYHQFPAELVRKPLTSVQFAGRMFSVPHGGVEMKKYMYPTNWWKEIKPPS